MLKFELFDRMASLAARKSPSIIVCTDGIGCETMLSILLADRYVGQAQSSAVPSFYFIIVQEPIHDSKSVGKENQSGAGKRTHISEFGESLSFFYRKQLARFKYEPFQAKLPMTIGIVELGATTSQRCARYAQGGIIIMTAKTFCADVLHHRLSLLSVIGLIFCVTHDLGNADVSFFSFVEELVENSPLPCSPYLDLVTLRPWHLNPSNSADLFRTLRLTDIVVLSRTRAEIVDFYKQGPVLQVLDISVPISPDCKCLSVCLRNIGDEVMRELKSALERAPEAVGLRRKRKRGEDHVSFLLETLESLAKEGKALSPSRTAFLSEVLHLTSSRQVQQLIGDLQQLQQLHYYLTEGTPPQFLVALHNMLVINKVSAHGTSVPQFYSSGWTLSCFFPTVLAKATERVYNVSNRVVHRAEQSQSAPKVETLVSECTMRLGKTGAPLPVLLIVVGSLLQENTVITRLTNRKCEFEDIQFETFLAYYQRAFGNKTAEKSAELSQRDELIQAGVESVLKTETVQHESRDEEVVHDDDSDVEGVVDVVGTQNVCPSENHSVLLSARPGPLSVHNDGAMANEEEEDGVEITGTNSPEDYFDTKLQKKLLHRSHGWSVITVSNETNEEVMHICVATSKFLSFQHLLVLLSQDPKQMFTEQEVDKALLMSLPASVTDVLIYDADAAFGRRFEATCRILELEKVTERVSVKMICSKDSLDRSLIEAEAERDRAATRKLVDMKASLVAEVQCSRFSAAVASDELQQYSTVKSFSAGGEESAKKSSAAQLAKLVIYDEREFRATVVRQMCKEGLSVIPLTLTTGDYILSSIVAIERKSLPDFASSVMSGRLSAQLRDLQNAYRVPLLLIEYDSSYDFCLNSLQCLGGRWCRRSDSGESKRKLELLQKLVKILSTFRKVRVLWSRSMAHSAKIIQRLKFTIAADNPDPSDPIFTTNSADQIRGDARIAMQMLSRFPGVNTHNIGPLMAEAKTLVGLTHLTEDKLKEVIGDGNGARLFHFLHCKYK